MIKKYDPHNKFMSMFDPKTGFYARTGIIEDGKDTGVDPFMCSYPELIDVGIMGHCIHGKQGLCVKSGVQCYQNGLTRSDENMSVENFRKIAKESHHKSYQFALGGAGDPDQHEEFEEILKICREYDIVPNFTSSGLGFNRRIVDLCKQYCGAVAISWYRSEYTHKAIRMLVDAGVKTNIHYVLGNNTIDEALFLLEKNGFPKGINAIVFLLHKPVGLGEQKNVLQMDDERVQRFFKLIDEMNFPFRVGFDSCSVPGIINNCQSVIRESIDTCEGARWSMYVSADMKAYPCSFDNQDGRWVHDLSESSIQEAWNSEQFEGFRRHFIWSCLSCRERNGCMGGCPIREEIVLCKRKERKIAT